MIRFCIAVAVFLLAACQPNQNPDGVLRVGLAQMPVSLDPRYATDAASVAGAAIPASGSGSSG